MKKYILTIAVLLVAVFSHAQNFQEALDAYQEGNYENALQLAQDLPMDTQGNVANLLGHIYKRLQDLPQAQTYYEQALQQRISTYGSSHNQVAKIYNNLGILAQKKHAYEAAFDYFDQSTEIQVSEEQQATVYNNIANTLYDMGEYELAIEYYQEAFAGYTQEQYHYAYTNLAVVFQTQGKYGLAKGYLEQALFYRKTYLGQDHYLVAKLYNRLAYNAYMQGHYVEAEHYITNALASPHPNIEVRQTSLGYQQTIQEIQQQIPEKSIIIEEETRPYEQKSATRFSQGKDIEPPTEEEL